MVTVYCTLGFTPEKLFPSLRQREDVERAVVFHDAHPDSLKAIDDVARYCRSLGIPLSPVRVDAFDLVESATRIQSVIREHGAGPAVFNITGGTKVLAAAAILTCILEGVPAVYIHDTTQEEVNLPLVNMRYEELLSTPQKAVLQFIADNDGCSQTQLKDALQLSKPTVSHHVQRLVDNGLVQEARDAHDQRKKRLHLIPSARLLLGGTA